EQADEIECVRPLWMAGELRTLPGADVGEEFAAQFRDLLADLGELRRRGTVPRKALQIVHFPFELFEFAAALTLFHQRFLAHHFDRADAGHFLQPAYQALVDANSLVG